MTYLDNKMILIAIIGGNVVMHQSNLAVYGIQSDSKALVDSLVTDKTVVSIGSPGDFVYKLTEKGMILYQVCINATKLVSTPN